MSITSIEKEREERLISESAHVIVEDRQVQNLQGGLVRRLPGRAAREELILQLESKGSLLVEFPLFQWRSVFFY